MPIHLYVPRKSDLLTLLRQHPMMLILYLIFSDIGGRRLQFGKSGANMRQ
jgi:hypothetical protein